MPVCVSDSPQAIALVTPVWNDSVRLGRFGVDLARALAAVDLPIRWIVADDGSSESEKLRVKELVCEFGEIYPHVEAMLFEERSFKGGAVYAAWDACSEADWLAFVDADGAIDPDSIIRLIQAAMELGPNGGCVGIRHDAEETPVKRPFSRALSFKLFTFLVHRLLGIRFEDTQCGAKVLPAQGYRQVAELLQERGYIFDLELLLALERSGCRIVELRIPWREMSGGKIHPLRDAWPMLAGLLRIRKRLKSGGY